MTHARTSIRKTVISLLKNSALQKTVGDRIYESRVHPIDNPPAILIYTPQEQIIEYSIGFPRTQTRQLTLIIEAYAKANANIDMISDSLSLEIEEILGHDQTLGGMIKDLSLNSSETIFSSDGDKPIAVATLTYHITYRTKENSPHKLI
jgi:hypothetical protein